MQYYDALKVAAKEAGMTMSGISERIGRNAGYIANGIAHQSSPSISNAVLMMRACGFEVVALPMGEAPDGAMVIDPTPKAVEAESTARERKRAKLERQLEDLAD
ncbi:MAG: hypothetical protein IJ111_15390 [Eggerthellaceae bacterium]|nr:hypothetical protein [Eggerthellaceae bacterium]MBQ9044187.1 hypothetical protein [Eggerthellaceae bacterium]